MTYNFPTVMNVNDLAGALQKSQVRETTGLAGFEFLKMDFETGDWLVGQDSDIITDEEILVNTTTIQHGWILWSGGRSEKLMVSFTQPLPIPMEPIGGDSPSEGRSFQAALSDDGSMVAFDTNSYGGRKGVNVLLGKIKAHAAEGSKFLYPRVRLTSESYANKKRGGKLTYNPVFKITAWCNEADVEEGEAAPQVEDKNTTAPVPDIDELPAAEAPRRKRRKRKTAA